MRLAYLIELTATIALGSAAARWRWSIDQAWLAEHAQGDSYWTIVNASRGLLVGLGLGGLIGLGVELARRQSPRPWGFGRWVWAVLGWVLVFRPVCPLLSGLASQLLSESEPWLEFWGRQPEYLGDVLFQQSENDALALILALLISRRFAKPEPTTTDAREWAGRVFALLAVITNFGADLVGALLE